MFKKSGDSRAYDDLSSDPDFQQDVFGLNQEYIKEKSDDTTRLGLFFYLIVILSSD